MREKGRFASVDALRGIAFLMVFIYHSGLANTGAKGVTVFILLSGFLLILRHGTDPLPVGPLPALRFSCRHIRRLYPLHLIMSAAALPFLWRAMKGDAAAMLKRAAVNALLIQTWFPKANIRYSMNNLSWTLSAMVFLYACFPALRRALAGLCKGSRILVWMIGLGLCQFGVCFALHSAVRDPELYESLTYNSPIYRLGDFAIGCLLGRLFLSRKGARTGEVRSALLLLVFVLTVACSDLLPAETTLWWKRTVYALPGACCVIWLFAENGFAPVRALSACRPLVYLGRISGYAYLIHEMIMRHLRYAWPFLNRDVPHRLVLAAVSLILTVLLAEGYRAAARMCETALRRR